MNDRFILELKGLSQEIKKKIFTNIISSSQPTFIQE